MSRVRSTDGGAAVLRHIDFLVLAVLAAGPLHGYGVVQAIDQLTDGGVRLRPGDVYRVLYRLHRHALLAPAEAPRGAADSDRRSYYAITRPGQEALHREAELLSGVAARLLGRAGSAPTV